MKSFYSQRLAVFVVLGLALAVIGGLWTSAEAGKDEKAETKAFLGVYLNELDDDDREALNFEGKGGVLIEGVVDDGPAEEAGLDEGDIIIKFDGKDVESADHLRELITARKPGDKIKVIVNRDGKEKKFKLKLGEQPERMVTTVLGHECKMLCPKIQKSRTFLGVEIETLEGQLAEYFGVKAGVLIEEVVEESPAEKAELKAGDVIVMFGDKEIETESGLRQAILEHNPEDEVAIKVIRRGKDKTLTAKLGKAPENIHMEHGGLEKKIIIRKDIEGLDDLGEIIGDIIEDIDIEIIDDDLREELEELKEELEELKKELREELKELREKKK